MTVNPFSELPLAVFTTLVPLAIGCFVALAITVLMKAGGEEAQAKLGRGLLAPVALMIVAFVGAFFHLHDPLHAVGAFSGLGSSPLSNEIFVASLFFVVAVICAVIGWMGKLNGTVGRVFLVIGCVLGAALAVFTGLAYFVSTIPSWANPWPSVEMLGYSAMAAIGGGTVASFLGVSSKGLDRIVRAIAIAGLVVAAAATVVHFMDASSAQGVFASGSQLVSAALPYLVGAAILALAAVAGFAIAPSQNKAVLLLCWVALLVAIFCARLAFYCLQLNVGL